MLDELISDGSDSDHPFYHKSMPLRVVVGLTSALSIVGSLLIILSYICFKDLRTTAREILLHISFMDMGVGLSNLVGIGVNFARYYNHTTFQDNEPLTLCTTKHFCNVSSVIEKLCIAQGSLAAFFTIGSILWTICLSMYLYILISQKGTREAKIFLKFAYFFCYLIPIGIIVWLNLTHRVGYSPFESTGWCGSIFVLPNKQREIVASIFGYNLWIFLTFVLVPVLSISAHMYIRDEVYTMMNEWCVYITYWQFNLQVKFIGSNLQSIRLHAALQKLDYKFLLVPVVFILLRIWSFFGDVWFVYCNHHSISPHYLAKGLMYLEVC